MLRRAQKLPAWWPACGMLVLREGRCSLAACGKPLTGRQTRWCSRKCTRVFLVNHQWTPAQLAALKRDGYTCRHCGFCPGKQPDRIGRMIWRRRHHGMEVNHIAPLNGRGYRIGCVHHQENLETLCHSCHLEVTMRQRAIQEKRRSRMVKPHRRSALRKRTRNAKESK